MFSSHKIQEVKVRELVEQINDLKVFGYELGETLVDFLQIELVIGQGNWSLKDYLILRINRLRYFWLGNKKMNLGNELLNFQKSKGLPLITFINPKRHMEVMSAMLATAINNDNKNFNAVYYGDKEDYSYANYHSARNDLRFESLPIIDLKKWRKGFRVFSKDLKSIIAKFVQTHHLPKFYQLWLEFILMTQSQYIRSFEVLVDRLKPSMVLTEYDKNYLVAPLAMVARKSDIPVFTQMHGAINMAFPYLPFLANEVLVWGERQKAILSELGADAKHLHICGTPQLSDENLKVSKSDFEFLDPERPLVVLATNPMAYEQRSALMELFGVGTSNLSHTAMIRLHPSEDLKDYDLYSKKYPHLIIDQNTYLNYDEVLALADVCCVYNSAFAIDALVHGKVLIVLGIDEYIGQCSDILDHGGAIFIKDAKALENNIIRLSKDQSFYEEAQIGGQDYRNLYCAYLGKEAAEKIWVKTKELSKNYV